MTRFYLFIFTFLIATSSAFAQPANDPCSAAIEIFRDTVVNFSTIGATTDGPTHDCFGDNDSIPLDIWYIYTADFTGEAKWSNCGTADYDSRMVVYQAGVDCSNLAGNDFFCNDDGPAACSAAAFTSEVIFPVTEGETYLLRLGGFAADTIPSTSGGGTVLLTESEGPENNFCAAAIEAFIGTTDFSNVNATTDGPEHPDNPCFGFGDNTVQADIWYTFIPNADGTIEWSTCDMATFDTRLAVYTGGAGCPFLDADLIACNDDGPGCPGFSSSLFFDATAGTTYYLRLGGFGGDQGSGSFTLTNTTPPPVPDNNDCLMPELAEIISAEAADAFEGIYEGTTIGGDFVFDDYQFPPCLGNTNGGEFSDVWYAFNSLGNTTVEMRFFSQTPEASFIIDFFNNCGEQVDFTTVGGTCFLTDPENTVVFDTLTNLPAAPADYLIRISTRLTTETPGDFFFQLVAEENTTVSVEEIPVAEDLVFYPNPVTDKGNLLFTLEEAKDVNISVFNTLGQRSFALDKQNLNQGENNIEVDMSNLAPGLYMMEISSETERQTVKFYKN